jgi:uncharacterized membrane protein YqiK
MAEVNIVKIEGKPIEKLIETISNGIGTLYRPRAIRKEAEAKAYETKAVGEAEASKIADIGNATAEAYRKQVEAMGSDNFSQFKITEEIGKNGIKIIPDVLITGGENGGPISGLLGLELLKKIQIDNKSETEAKADVKPVEKPRK